MPDFPIIDTHVHLADTKHFNHPWMESVPSLNQTWTLKDFDAALDDVRIGKMLFMEVNCRADDVVREVAWATSLAQQDSRLKGVIAKAPVELGTRVVETLQIYRENPLVKAIRRLIQEETEGFCLRPAFLEGLRQVGACGYVFDICIHHTQLGDTLEMVRRCPDVRFVLDHIGKPGIATGVREPWSTQIGELAAMENVACKISGVVTEANHQQWTFNDLRPFLDRVVEAFGFDRLLFGGDWFVQTLASTYPRWVEVVDRTLSGCSDEEIRKVYVTNAETIYGI